MSSGCMLLSANPASDHRVLKPGVHYLDCEPNAELIRGQLEEIAQDHRRMREIAQAGSERVRGCMDVRRGVRDKLSKMGWR